MSHHPIADHLPLPPVRPTWRQSLAIGLFGAAATAACLFGAKSAFAQENGEGSDDWTILLGAGAIYAPDYEGSEDHELLPFPFVSIEYKDIVYLRGSEIGANLLRIRPADDVKLSIGPIARYRRDRPEKRNDALNGLGKVDSAFEVGGLARLAAGPTWIEVSLAQDVADGHDGLVGTATAGADVRLSEALSLTASASASWADEDYMQSYFSVNAAQAARSGLPTFITDKGVKDVGATMTLNYRIDDRWLVSATGGYTRLLNDAKDAPLVRLRGSADQWQGGLFLAYRF
ncbi:MAG: MipA/OmpV family protein [Sphingopyxis sp.]|uniref:MipA/OmpV family protein n=1 Tax=Sphingopyxis sp. TaxID=1908224 RepID=UPI002ABAB5BF|nr:MipA/OmpV family protein [Sphingopyxis sp.]MDZ3832730.1 MipA/OmpV family protein [Sphingopyxis sp.]